MSDPTQKINIEATQQATRNNNWVKEVTSQLQGQTQQQHKISIDPVKIEKQNLEKENKDKAQNNQKSPEFTNPERAQAFERSLQKIPEFSNSAQEKSWVDKNAIKEQSDRVLKGASKLLKSTVEILGWGKKESNNNT